MASYRCYFLDTADHIRAAEVIEADALDGAVDRALALLRERPHHHAVELWDGARKVYPNDAPPAV